MSGGHSSSGIGGAIKKGVGVVHGTGEAIRGNFNAAIDKASGDRVGVDKNTAIASAGANEIEHGYHRTGHGAGITPVDTDHERLNTTHSTSTNYGSHSTNTGNKLDPRFDSDLDHRGTATGSTNVGPHSNNVANKLDPRFDSDADHRANPNNYHAPTLHSQTDGSGSTSAPFGSKWGTQTAYKEDHDHDEHSNCHAQHIHRGSISDGTILEPAQKLDPILGTNEESTSNGNSIATELDTQVNSGTGHRGTEDISTNHGSDSVEISNKEELRIDSDSDDRGSGINTQNRRAGTLTRRETDPLIHPGNTSEEGIRISYGPGSDDELDRHARRTSLSNKTPHSTSTSNEPRSTATPHKSGFLNLLDPRVDRNSGRQMRSSGS